MPHVTLIIGGNIRIISLQKMNHFNIKVSNLLISYGMIYVWSIILNHDYSYIMRVELHQVYRCKAFQVQNTLEDLTLNLRLLFQISNSISLSENRQILTPQKEVMPIYTMAFFSYLRPIPYYKSLRSKNTIHYQQNDLILKFLWSWSQV